MRKNTCTDHLSSLFITLTAVLILNFAAFAQTTEFNYQGSLKDGANAANGNYDFEFVLFDSLSAGTQFGPILPRNAVAVANGIFAVSLDFGSQFPGANRFLEIRVRQTGGGGLTTLTPRQPVNSSPYSVKSLNTDNAVNATNATNAVNFSGPLAGDVTGTQNATVLGNNTVTTAKIADSAITVAKIASGQVVTGINGLKDNITLAPGTNITITPKGNTLTIESTSGGVGGSGTPNRIPYWISPSTLGDSLISQTASAVQLPNMVQLAAGAQGNNITFGSPNGETGMTIAGASTRADIRFDGLGTLRMVAGPAGGPPSPDNGIAVFSTGQVKLGAGSIGSTKLTVYASPQDTAIYADSLTGTGVFGSSDTGTGVTGSTNSGGTGVKGSSQSGLGVHGISSSNYAVYGQSTSSIGVVGTSGSGDGISGVSNSKRGVAGGCIFSGCIALSANGTSWFQGNTTPLTVENAGTGTGVAIGSEPTAGYIFAYDYSTNQPRNLFINGPGGRVHIGTACAGSPDQTLSVCGNASKVGGGSWQVLSDARLKNIKGRFTGGLAAVMKLQPIKYHYKPENGLEAVSNTEYIGFSAQAVEKVIPEAVTKNEQGYRMVNNDPIMWTMLNAIKEQQAQIEQQQKEIATLRSSNAAVNMRLQTIEKRLARKLGTTRRIH